MTRSRADLLATLLMIGFVLLMAYAVLTLLPEQISLPNQPACVNDQDGEPGVPECPAPGERACVTVALPDRGMPDCSGRGGSPTL